MKKILFCLLLSTIAYISSAQTLFFIRVENTIADANGLYYIHLDGSRCGGDAITFLNLWSYTSSSDGIYYLSISEAKEKKSNGTLLSVGVNQEHRFFYDSEKSTGSYTVYRAQNRTKGPFYSAAQLQVKEDIGYAYVALSSDCQSLITFQTFSDPNDIRNKVYYKRVNYNDIPSNAPNENWNFLKQ